MRAAATTLLSQTAFLEVEVGELLFEGYKDPFLDKVYLLGSSYSLFGNFKKIYNKSSLLYYFLSIILFDLKYGFH